MPGSSEAETRPEEGSWRRSGRSRKSWGKSRVGEPPKVEERTSPPVVRDWRAALKEFAEGVKELYGPRLHSVILYGSRGS